ncbi:MAG: site-specific DNA-methyltransferase [Methanoregula sp.]|nr:site-specific DNA-methyltransferase [Methanoregula sp.]
MAGKKREDVQKALVQDADRRIIVRKLDEVDESLKTLQDLLRKLFQFDIADLDSGIYRIMNKKRDAIRQFISIDLPRAVDEEFGKVTVQQRDVIDDEVKTLKREIVEKLGADALSGNSINVKYASLPIAKKFETLLSEKIAARDHATISQEFRRDIYNHINAFFSRYYDDGDFMSKRRRSSAKEEYSVPYNGEEVVLHWANKDQYFIKTMDHFQNLTVKDPGEHYTLHFRITNAHQTVNDVKDTQQNYFVIHGDEQPVQYNKDNRDLIILFEYRPIGESEKNGLNGVEKIQEFLVDEAIKKILAVKLEKGLIDLLIHVVNVEKGTTWLKFHLVRYVKENKTDYFIHKNLQKFLNDELDFYIKNEMFYLDDLGTDREVPLAPYVNRVQVMKAVSLKIIDFLSQIENFQKRLWEKKKFVISTNYCMTLDLIPESFYPEITSNMDQIAEWKDLFSIGDPTGQATLNRKKGAPIDAEFLKENPYLVLDTKHFPQEFKDKLLATFDDLEDATGGLMVKSENWQALNLLQERYKEQVKCIYIDPPYNTGDKKQFNYKDNYQHSSWLAMMGDRISNGLTLLSKNGVFFSSIDDNEVSNLISLMNSLLGDENLISVLSVVNNFSGRSDRKNIATAHEHMLMYKINNFEAQGLSLPENHRNEYTEKDEKGPYRLQGLRKRGSGARREDRPNLFYPIYYNPTTEEIKLEKTKGFIEILPKLSDHSDGRWRWGKETVTTNIDFLTIKKVSTRDEYDVFQKDYLYINGAEKRVKAKSIWFETNYSSDFATTAYKKIMGDVPFNNPKSPELIKDICSISSQDMDIILDYFAGSGTTAQAVLNLNREDNSIRKYILVEMAGYFDTVMKPRIEKAMYSSEWKDGKPQKPDGISHMFKYIALEQYEDTLNNIDFREAGTVERTLADLGDYFLRYMLDFETRDSLCRFNISKIERPFEYTLKIMRDGIEHIETVDLVETFNYLLGIHVKRLRRFDQDGLIYRVVNGEIIGRSTTIIWRTMPTDSVADKKAVEKALQKDKKFIEETILKDKNFNADKVFINGDFYVEKALNIEHEFQKCMNVEFKSAGA